MFSNDDFVDKKLRILLEDAVFFLDEASQTTSEDADSPATKYSKLLRESAFTRMSIIASALLLESAANCCISTLAILDRVTHFDFLLPKI